MKQAHWKLNDNLATDVVIDETGNNNGTLSDAGGTATTAAHSVEGVVDRALSFDSVDDYVDTGNAFQSIWRNSFSISMWVRPDDGQPTSQEYFLGSNNALNQDRIYVSVLDSGRIRALIESNNIVAFHDSSVVFTDGQQDWHHIVFVGVADTTVGVFVDGVDEGTTDASGLTFNDWTSGDELFLGANDSDGTANNHYAGKIDNVMIFDKALTTEQVRTLYRDGTVPFFRSRYSGNSAFRLLRRRFSPNSSF